MALPKRRHSNARSGKRRAHDALRLPARAACGRCGQPVVPHRICGNCGYYRGRSVVPLGKRKKP